MRIKRFMADSKPYEELYDLEADPYELHNLLDRTGSDRQLAEVLQDLRVAHEQWVLETRDTGLIPEAELESRSRNLGTRWAILQRGDADVLLSTLMYVSRVACNPHADVDELLLLSQHTDAAVRYWA